MTRKLTLVLLAATLVGASMAGCTDEADQNTYSPGAPGVGDPSSGDNGVPPGDGSESAPGTDTVVDAEG